jgi:hypothetical protein
VLVLLNTRSTHAAESHRQAILCLTMSLFLELETSDEEDEQGACLMSLTPLLAPSAFTYLVIHKH